MTDTEETTSQPSTSKNPPPAIQAPLVQGITPPKPLNTTGNIVDDWKEFKQVWENYSIITSLNTQSEPYRVALFLHCLGPDALKIYNGMQFANEVDKKTLSKIIEKFDEFTIGEVNETYERYVFNGRNQGPDETIDAYIAALRSLAKTCGFCDCLRESLLRDRIVLGVHNNNMRKRLLQERKLDLKKCVDLCRSSEAARSQLKNISGASGSDNTHDVNKLYDHSKYGRKPAGKQHYDRNVRGDAPKKQAYKCRFCGRNHPMQKELCPAWNKRCQACNGRNHFAAVCKKTQSRGVHGVSEQQDSDSDDDRSESDYEFLAGIAVEPAINAVKQTTGPAKEIYTEMEIKDQRIKFQIDCGASINIINKCHATGSPVTPSSKTLKMGMERK